MHAARVLPWCLDARVRAYSTPKKAVSAGGFIYGIAVLNGWGRRSVPRVGRLERHPEIWLSASSYGAKHQQMFLSLRNESLDLAGH